jgi:hypothetical protein
LRIEFVATTYLIEVLADVFDDLGARDECVASRVVHDKVEEAVAVALFLVLVAEVLGGQHAQARCEEDDFS